VAAVRAAHAHEILLPREVIVEIAMRVADARQQADEIPPVETLTPRELDVLRLLAEGLDSATICERLSISPNTLRTHTQNMMSKLGTHSKLETVAYALRNGLVEPPLPASRRTPRPG
jgi:DNA-binding NarL/FixJ family response regulator